MPRIRLIHWNPEGAEGRARQLRKSGYDVVCAPLDRAGLRALKKDPPDAIVIDLTCTPSQGRDIGIALRRHGGTRSVPLVFAGGEPQKVERVREHLPDATFTSWRRVKSSLGRALSRGSADLLVPDSDLAGYAGTPVAKKLGIGEGSVVALVGAPDGFERTLGRLPAGAVLKSTTRGQCDLVIWFVTSRADLVLSIERLGTVAGRGGLWIVWPKKSSGYSSDLTQAVVREVGLAADLVDYKVCSVDETWSGLRFARRRPE